jgi:hypothetical protein
MLVIRSPLFSGQIKGSAITSDLPEPVFVGTGVMRGSVMIVKDEVTELDTFIPEELRADVMVPDASTVVPPLGIAVASSEPVLDAPVVELEVSPNDEETEV